MLFTERPLGITKWSYVKRKMAWKQQNRLEIVHGEWICYHIPAVLSANFASWQFFHGTNRLLYFSNRHHNVRRVYRWKTISYRFSFACMEILDCDLNGWTIHLIPSWAVWCDCDRWFLCTDLFNYLLLHEVFEIQGC